MSTNKTLSSSQMLNMASIVIQSTEMQQYGIKLTVGTAEGKGAQRCCSVSWLLPADEFPRLSRSPHDRLVNPRKHRLRQ